MFERDGLLTTTMLFPAFADEIWRSSKLIGLNVYNDQNEKLGDISEILLDKSGPDNRLAVCHQGRMPSALAWSYRLLCD
jgi:PRC-barrel domain